jgi:hypothetical protein
MTGPTKDAEAIAALAAYWSGEHNGDIPQMRRAIAAVDAHRKAVTDAMPWPDTYPMPAHGWTCFHCGETFTTPGSARDHFGCAPCADPACRIKVGEERGLVRALRRAEEELARRAQPASGPADLSLVPNDIYVVSASTPDGVVYDAICCSVPMAIGPEVRYTRAEAAEDQLATVRKERDEARRYEERQNEEIERADRALQRIGMALGSTDEWADQGSMIFDVVSRVEGVAAQLVTVTKERDAALADLAVSEDELAELNAQIEAGEQEG